MNTLDVTDELDFMARIFQSSSKSSNSNWQTSNEQTNQITQRDLENKLNKPVNVTLQLISEHLVIDRSLAQMIIQRSPNCDKRECFGAQKELAH